MDMMISFGMGVVLGIVLGVLVSFKIFVLGLEKLNKECGGRLVDLVEKYHKKNS